MLGDLLEVTGGIGTVMVNYCTVNWIAACFLLMVNVVFVWWQGAISGSLLKMWWEKYNWLNTTVVYNRLRVLLWCGWVAPVVLLSYLFMHEQRDTFFVYATGWIEVLLYFSVYWLGCEMMEDEE